MQQKVLNLLINACDIDAQDLNKRTALHLAANVDNSQAIKFLLKKHANANIQDKNGKIPLHIAILKGVDLSIIALLIQVSDINTQDSKGKTPLFLAAELGNFDAVKLLLEKGADANILSTEGWHPLDAAHFYKHSKIAELLKDITQKDELEDPDRQASEMIQAHLEADQGDFKKVRKILHKINNLDVQDSNGDTILHKATSHDDIKTVKFLLKRGANANISNNEGCIPLHKSISFGLSCYEISKLLIEKSNINAQNLEGETALYLAVSRERLNLVKLLLAYDADTHIANKVGWTPLHVAARMGCDSALLQCLIEKTNVNILDQDRQSALHMAASSHNTENIKLLLENGADRTIKNKVGCNPYDIAMFWEYEDIAELLRT
ncbi:MAG: ankyrin repeat domain-containing protein [Parachlamydiaceae bacterium]|nr:MAG: ankyrin repeat domain-containing protein [Parachlamydiaceae bacterium]